MGSISGGHPERRIQEGRSDRIKSKVGMIPRVVRVVRVWACVLGAVALVVGVAGCAGPGLDAASPSPTPTFLAEETMCEVVPSRILVEEMSFRTTDYTFEHRTAPWRKNGGADIFSCNLNGRRNSMTTIFRIRIAYWPDATLNASSPYPFSDLDNDTYHNDPQPVTFDDVEGRGYVWLDKDRQGLTAAWLYPDDHALEIQFFTTGTTDAYDQDDIAAMTDLLHALIPAIPPVAAGPDLWPTQVPSPY